MWRAVAFIGFGAWSASFYGLVAMAFGVRGFALLAIMLIGATLSVIGFISFFGPRRDHHDDGDDQGRGSR